ncbi:TetR/AcrR family transcriptional regulator [Microbaculum marinum]|uniref:TetR/AcrR family transcriptional regulator n=1 Tax=Microbaculum marinum TaxID=1764581 RepID=A0AAW9RYH4_9HYPH
MVATTPSSEAPRRRRRMSWEERERVIIEEATAYFAEQGLSAGTAELARRIGITQPLLYRYFSTKGALIDRVYEELLPASRYPAWERLLDDDSIPLRTRLRTFYGEYFHQVLTYEHVRLFLYSGLANNIYNARHYDVLTRRIFTRIGRAIRRDIGGRDDGSEFSPLELEVVQSIHAAIFHTAYRRWVHGEQLSDDLDALIATKIDLCLDGADSALRWALKVSMP